jgi:hypothetical protein
VTPPTPMSLPNGLIVGTQRAGTTWIYEYLKACTHVSSTRGVKETFFFDQRYDKGLEWYASHFMDTPVRVEVAPTYFYCTEAPGRIHETLGNIQLACVLRDPVERSLSLYHHYLRMGRVRGGIVQACRDSPDIVESSRYSRHLVRWIKVFGHTNFKVLLFEDLLHAPTEFVAALGRHFGFPVQPIPDHLHEPVNPQTTAPNPWLARQSSRIADWLRAHRAYWPINVLKALGLRSAIYGRNHVGVKGTQAELDFLRAQLGDEASRTEDILGKCLVHWRA